MDYKGKSNETMSVVNKDYADSHIAGKESAISSPSDNDVISYNASMGRWVARQLQGGSGGSAALASLTDVQLTSPAQNDGLVYDTVSQRWVNKPQSEIANAAGYCTKDYADKISDNVFTSPYKGYSVERSLIKSQTGGAMVKIVDALIPAGVKMTVGVTLTGNTVSSAVIVKFGTVEKQISTTTGSYYEVEYMTMNECDGISFYFGSALPANCQADITVSVDMVPDIDLDKTLLTSGGIDGTGAVVSMANRLHTDGIYGSHILCLPAGYSTVSVAYYDIDSREYVTRELVSARAVMIGRSGCYAVVTIKRNDEGSLSVNELKTSLVLEMMDEEIAGMKDRLLVYTSLSYQMEKGRTIKVTGNIGQAASVVKSFLNGWNARAYEVHVGDRYIITGTGGDGVRLYSLVSDAGILVAQANANVTLVDAVVDVTVDGMLYVNAVSNKTHDVMKAGYTNTIVKEIIDKDSDTRIGQFGLQCTGYYECPSIPAFTLPAEGERVSAIYGWYDALMARFPDYITKVDCDSLASSLGISRPSALSAYDTYMYRFVPAYTPNASGAGVTETDATRLKVLVVTGTHPEYISIWDMYHTMRLICEEWEGDVNLEELRWNAEFYIVPCAVPYGVEKNSRTNANGVDPNRNMPTYDWMLGGAGTSTYSGEEAGSEYESKILMMLIDEIHPDIFIDHHNTNAASDGKNMMYITSRIQRCLDIAAAHVSQMTRKWKMRSQTSDPVFAGVFPSNSQDPLTIFGFVQNTKEFGTRGVYACEHGCDGYTYESNNAIVYEDGEQSSSATQTDTELVATTATEGFINFLLRALVYKSNRVNM